VALANIGSMAQQTMKQAMIVAAKRGIKNISSPL